MQAQRKGSVSPPPSAGQNLPTHFQSPIGCCIPTRGGAWSLGGGCAGTQRPWQVGWSAQAGSGQRDATSAASCYLAAAPESLSPGATAEEAPEEDEDDAEAEDPERGAGSGGRSGSLGGSSGCTAGPGMALGGALTRRAVTLRVLLKDELLEPGEGVLSIYYLVSDPQRLFMSSTARV